MTQEATSPVPVPEWTLGWRLRRALAEAHISVEEMADRLGYERKALSRWMHDKEPPKRAVVVAWATECGVPLPWLQGDTGGSGPRPKRQRGDEMQRARARRVRPEGVGPSPFRLDVRKSRRAPMTNSHARAA